MVGHEDCRVGKRREKDRSDERMHVNWMKVQEKKEKT